jgi:calcineurin-like phosphoesterase
MTGVLNSVIGVNLKDTLPLYLQGIKKRFHVAEKGEVVFNALVVDIDETSLKPLKVQRLQKLLPWEELKGISV